MFNAFKFDGRNSKWTSYEAPGQDYKRPAYENDIITGVHQQTNREIYAKEVMNHYNNRSQLVQRPCCTNSIYKWINVGLLGNNNQPDNLSVDQIKFWPMKYDQN